METVSASLGLTAHLRADFNAALARVADALTAVPEVGLLLPCNIVVTQMDDHTSEVSIVDPLSMLGLMGRPGLEPIAAEARARLDRVITELRK